MQRILPMQQGVAGFKSHHDIVRFCFWHLLSAFVYALYLIVDQAVEHEVKHDVIWIFWIFWTDSFSEPLESAILICSCLSGWLRHEAPHGEVDV